MTGSRVLLAAGIMAVCFLCQTSTVEGGDKVGQCRHLVPGGPPRHRVRRCHPDLCQQDTNCPGNQLCCFDGCAKACSAPVLIKPGFCPFRDGRAPPGILCRNDYDCPGRQKCCNTFLGPTGRLDCVSPSRTPIWRAHGREV